MMQVYCLRKLMLQANLSAEVIVKMSLKEFIGWSKDVERRMIKNKKQKCGADFGVASETFSVVVFTTTF